MSTLQILLLIAAFLLLTIGSFIYFIATWDPEQREPVSSLAPTPSLALVKILPPEASALNKGAIT